MPPIQADYASDRHLRFIFSDRVLSFGLSADATLQEIAAAWADLADDDYGEPVSVDVTFAPIHRSS